MSKLGPNFSHFKVEQYLNGELNSVEFREFEALMKANSELSSYVANQKSIQYEGPIPVFQTKTRRVFETVSSGTSVFSQWWKKINDAIAPVLPPQVGWAMGLCLMAGAVLILSRPDRAQVLGSEYTAKGSSIPFQLHIGGHRVQPGQSSFATAGDTLAFAYRSLAGMHVQVWYQDDGGEIKPYVASPNGSPAWIGSSSWRDADSKVVLFSDWNKESIWVLWSEENFNSQDARRVLEGGRGGENIHKTSFQLIRTQ